MRTSYVLLVLLHTHTGTEEQQDKEGDKMAVAVELGELHYLLYPFFIYWQSKQESRGRLGVIYSLGMCV